ncbi:MAG: VanZ family protein [Lactovum sp.]
MIKENRKTKIILYFLLAVYFLVIINLTVFRGGNSRESSVNLIPFLTLFSQLKSFLLDFNLFSLFNLIGNLALFFPLAYTGALEIPKMRTFKVSFLVFFLLTVFIEFFQYLLRCGASDVDDLILNVLGALLMLKLYHYQAKKMERRKLYHWAVMIVILSLIPYTFYAFQGLFGLRIHV